MGSAGLGSLSLRIPLDLRLRAYAIAVLLSFLSVPFLHLYLAVDLSPAELALHALDIALGTALLAAGTELAGLAWQRRTVWRVEGVAGWAALALLLAGLGTLWAFTGPRDLLPRSDTIRHKHVSSCYGDMSLRALPLAALIGYAAVEAARRSRLQRELDELRRLAAELQERLAGTVEEPTADPLVLRYDGGEIAVAPDSVRRVRAQENYCEFVLGAGQPRPLVRMTLADALERLPGDLFLQTHRSHVANLRHVREVVRRGRSCALRLDDGEEVPVARGRLAEVRDRVRRVMARG